MSTYQQKYYFYRCADERFAPDNDYFDHTSGIAGYKQRQPRKNPIGHMTVNALHKELSKPKHYSAAGSINGQRSGYTNVTRSYGERY